jgi:hypothetical protein
LAGRDAGNSPRKSFVSTREMEFFRCNSIVFMGLGGKGGRGGGKRAKMRRKDGIDVFFLQCGWSPWLISSTPIFIVRRRVEMICNDFAGACGAADGAWVPRGLWSRRSQRRQGIENREWGGGMGFVLSHVSEARHGAPSFLVSQTWATRPMKCHRSKPIKTTPVTTSDKPT